MTHQITDDDNLDDDDDDDQPPTSTQPSIPLGYVNQILACLAGVKAEHVQLYKTAGKAV